MNSYRTTILGGLIIVGVFAYAIVAMMQGQAITLQEILAGLTALAGAGAAITARDNSKSSEDVGVNPKVSDDHNFLE